MKKNCKNCGCPPIVKIWQSVVNGKGEPIQLTADHIIWSDSHVDGRKLQWSILVNGDTKWESGFFIPSAVFPVGSASTFEEVNTTNAAQNWIDFLQATFGISVALTDKLEIKLEATNSNNKTSSGILVLQEAQETTLIPLTCGGEPVTCGGEMIYC